MLILTRKPGESLYIGDTVKITIVEIKGNQIRVGIDAPSELRIYREEIYVQILEENKKAAEGAVPGSAGLDQLSGAWKGSSRSALPGSSPRSGSSSASKLTGADFVVRKKRRKRPEDEDGNRSTSGEEPGSDE
jgi:carbon storage regulator